MQGSMQYFNGVIQNSLEKEDASMQVHYNCSEWTAVCRVAISTVRGYSNFDYDATSVDSWLYQSLLLIVITKVFSKTLQTRMLLLSLQ